MFLSFFLERLDKNKFIEEERERARERHRERQRDGRNGESLGSLRSSFPTLLLHYSFFFYFHECQKRGKKEKKTENKAKHAKKEKKGKNPETKNSLFHLFSLSLSPFICAASTTS